MDEVGAGFSSNIWFVVKPYDHILDVFWLQFVVKGLTQQSLSVTVNTGRPFVLNFGNYLE